MCMSYKWFEARLHCTTGDDGQRSQVAPASMRLRLQLVANGLDLTKNPQQVPTEYFLDVISAVSAIKQGLRNFGQVCS